MSLGQKRSGAKNAKNFENRRVLVSIERTL